MSTRQFLVGRRGFSLGFMGALLATFGSREAKAAEGSPGVNFKGTLYPIGGAAVSTLRRFSELAGGVDAKILILPHPSSTPKDTAEELSNEFTAYGVRNIDTMMPGETKSLGKYSAVFMSGGDQSRLLRLLDKEFVQQLRAFLQDGNVVGGTSAGAAAVAPRMIADGMGDGMPRSGSLVIADGLGLLPGYMVDTHVMARARQDRLMVGLSMEPSVKGIGLDEDTAVEIKNGRATVRGHGIAHVYRRASDFKSEIKGAAEGNMAGVQNVVYSIYPAGESFDL